MSGYQTKHYAESLSDYGTPIYLPGSKGWILKQQIANTDLFDARGIYPVFSCEHPEKLNLDFRELGNQIISLSFVTDPFSSFVLKDWKIAMPQVCYHYKNHIIIDLLDNYEQHISKHHLRNIRKAGQSVTVKHTEEPEFLLKRWNELYKNLIKRHQIQGIARFSAKGFKKQFSTPGIRATWAESNGSIVGIVLWYKMKNNIFYHLAAYDETGYKMNASYAIFNFALQKFREEEIEYVSLGAGAGLTNSGTDGLTRFKTGWSKNTRPVYFCGKIFNKTLYNELVGKKQSQGFFPAYRAI